MNNKSTGRSNRSTERPVVKGQRGNDSAAGTARCKQVTKGYANRERDGDIGVCSPREKANGKSG